MDRSFRHQDIDRGWLEQAVDRINNGESYDSVLQNVSTCQGILPKISRKAFLNAVKFHNLELHPKRGRKPIELDPKVEDSIKNLHSINKRHGINSTARKLKNDIYVMNSNLDEWNEMRSFVDPSDPQTMKDFIYNSGDTFESIPRHLDIEVLPQAPDSFEPFNVEKMKKDEVRSAIYLEPELESVSFNMVRKVFRNIYPNREEEIDLHNEEEEIIRYVAKYNYQIVHADIHYYRHEIQNYLYAIIDDRSRYILDFQFFQHKTAANTWAVAERCLRRYQIKPAAFWLDNGLENTGVFKRNIENLGIKIINITPRNAQANGKIERFWPSVEKQSDVRSDVAAWVFTYNHRPHPELPINPNTRTNYTPNQMLEQIEYNWRPGLDCSWYVNGQELPLFNAE